MPRTTRTVATSSAVHPLASPAAATGAATITLEIPMTTHTPLQPLMQAIQNMFLYLNDAQFDSLVEMEKVRRSTQKKQQQQHKPAARTDSTATVAARTTTTAAAKPRAATAAAVATGYGVDDDDEEEQQPAPPRSLQVVNTNGGKKKTASYQHFAEEDAFIQFRTSNPEEHFPVLKRHMVASGAIKPLKRKRNNEPTSATDGDPSLEATDDQPPQQKKKSKDSRVHCMYCTKAIQVFHEKACKMVSRNISRFLHVSANAKPKKTSFVCSKCHVPLCNTAPTIPGWIDDPFPGKSCFYRFHHEQCFSGSDSSNSMWRCQQQQQQPAESTSTTADDTTTINNNNNAKKPPPAF